MAALGSKEAYAILDQMGETAYANYPQQMTKVRKGNLGAAAGFLDAEPLLDWLYSLQPLAGSRKALQYPAFMQTQAWTRKDLHTRARLVDRAEARHDSLRQASDGRDGRRGRRTRAAARLGRAEPGSLRPPARAGAHDARWPQEPQPARPRTRAPTWIAWTICSLSCSTCRSKSWPGKPLSRGRLRAHQVLWRRAGSDDAGRRRPGRRGPSVL